MSELKSLIEERVSMLGQLGELTDARILEGFAEARWVKESASVLELGYLNQIESRGLHSRDGHLCTEAWLAATQNTSFGSARNQVETAKALEQMPQTFEALKAGDISVSEAKMLVDARGVSPSAFEASESELVAAAKTQPVAGLARTIGYWRQKVDVELVGSREEALGQLRCLHTRLRPGGMVRIEGDLDPETGELLNAALASILDEESKHRAEDDERTWPQRRHDAFSEMLAQTVDGGGHRRVGAERPLLAVTVDAAVLAAAAAGEQVVGTGLCELDHAGPIPPAIALRIACDASVMRVVMSSESQPLDVGRRTPVVPAPMRRAVIVRDRTCRFPGCDRPHTWCDAHHIVHWARGGPTSVTNLLLLCRRHHRLIHGPSGFRLRMEKGKPVFRRPDGSRLDGRGPP